MTSVLATPLKVDTRTMTNINTTIDYSDLNRPEVAPTHRDLKKWIWRWFFSRTPLGVNGAVKRRWYVREHKMWEYSRGLAYTGASKPARGAHGPMKVLDVGGAMTMPVFYLAGLGDSVTVLDISEPMTRQMNEIAKVKGLKVDGRTTNLVDEDVTAEELGAPGGFDRVYCFCVIEHIPMPGQAVAARRMAGLLKPGGQMCITFDFGEHAPTEQPLYTLEHVRAIREAIGLPLVGGAAGEFADNGKRFPLNRNWPDKSYTFGSMFFQK